MARVLTVRQPWAFAIMVAGKDVENRSWSTKYRGRLWIHSGLNTKKEMREEALKVPSFVAAEKSRANTQLGKEMLQRGMLLGYVDLVDVHTAELCEAVAGPGLCSEWAQPGQYHWVLRDPRLMKPRPMKGTLGLRYFAERIENE